MSEVVVTGTRGIPPGLANCADRRTLWTHLCEGPSQPAFEPAPGGDGGRWPAYTCGSGATVRLAVSYGIGGHNAVTLLGAAEAS